MVDTMVLCPACKCTVKVEDDLEIGDCLVCDQCDEALIVVTLEPLELAVDEDEEDDEEDDDDDDDPEIGDEGDDLEDYEGDDDEEDD